MSARPKKLDSLTGLRALLALMVVFCHGWIRTDILPTDHWISKIVGEMGHCGVAGFFVLSGYILAHVYRDREWRLREFVINRVARIYPLYLLGLLFTLPIDWFSPGMSSEAKESALALSIILQQSWLPFSNGRFNGPGWTLSVEALFYMLFPILFALWKCRPTLYFWVTVSATIITGYCWNPDSFFLSHRFPLMRVWEFMFGMTLAIIPIRRSFAKAETIPLSMVLVSPVISALLHNSTPPFTRWLAMVIFSGIVIVILASRDSIVVDEAESEKKLFLKVNWMILGGEISYGVYLLHDGVQRCARVGFEMVFGVLLKEASLPIKASYLLITGMVSLLLAWICWKLVEIPARDFLRKRLATNV